MAIVNKFNVNNKQVTLDPDIIENMSANDVSYDASTQYDENTVGGKLSELSQREIYVIESVSDSDDEIVFMSNDETEQYACIGSYGAKAKDFIIKSDSRQISLKAFVGDRTSYNDVVENTSIALQGISFVKNRIVNKQNRCVVSFNGDSIIGSQLDDITLCPEFESGAFPPNLSKMIMARMFFDKYRFPNEDVQFRNLKHQDWVKVGFDKSQKYTSGTTLQTFNEIETYGCNSLEESAEIMVTGYKYFKLIWSECRPSGWIVDVLISIDNGEYITPTEAGLSLPDTISEGNAWTGTQTMVKYRICELDITKTYKVKIVPKAAPNGITFWGCEYWNNPRLDVVVEAKSGSTAIGQKSSLLEAIQDVDHKPILIIEDILCINDKSYIVNADQTIEGWAEANAYLHQQMKNYGIPVIAFRPHYVNFLSATVESIAKMNNLAYIDIQKKIEENPPAQSIVNKTDGLHLSNYGNIYYFEELEKLFG